MICPSLRISWIFRREKSLLLEKELTNINGKIYVFELHLKGYILSPYNIGQKHKIKAFSKILQWKWSLVSVLHKLLGHHKEFKVTEGVQYWQKGNRDRRGN